MKAKSARATLPVLWRIIKLSASFVLLDLRLMPIMDVSKDPPWVAETTASAPPGRLVRTRSVSTPAAWASAPAPRTARSPTTGRSVSTFPDVSALMTASAAPRARAITARVASVNSFLDSHPMLLAILMTSSAAHIVHRTLTVPRTNTATDSRGSVSQCAPASAAPTLCASSPTTTRSAPARPATRVTPTWAAPPSL